MNNQLEQTIAKIEALPDGADLYAGDWDNPPVADLQFTMSDLKVLAAEVKRLNHRLETIRNMSVYIHEKDPNPDPQFMADFYKTKLGDAVDHARKELEGE